MKAYLTLSLGLMLTIPAWFQQANSPITSLSRAEAESIEGAAGCPYVPMNPENVCEDSGSGTCQTLWWCGGGTCGVTGCSFAVSKRSGPTIIKTTPSNPAVESAAKNCNTIQGAGQRGSCNVPWNPFANCYCGAPWIAANCPGAFTELETCD